MPIGSLQRGGVSPAMNGSVAVIHLIDDDDEVRQALGTMLGAANRPFVSYARPESFLAAWRPDTEGVVLLNFRLGAETAWEVLKNFALQGIDLPVVVHSGDDEASVVVRTIRAGACDFLPKPVASERLLESLDKAMAEDAHRREPRQMRAVAAAKLAKLTPREIEVLRRLLLGERNKAVAQKLDIAPKTVEHHRAAIFRKLEVASLAAAALQYDAARGVAKQGL
jgi:FixJ family two-component response regulator